MANILANAGRAVITNRLKGSGTEPLYVGVGTGAGTAGVTDTTLFTEKAADLATGSGTRITGASTQQTTSVTNDTYQVAGTLTMTATGPVSVTNAGTLDNSTIGSGNLFMKGDFTGVPMNLNDQLTLTFKLQFS